MEVTEGMIAFLHLSWCWDPASCGTGWASGGSWHAVLLPSVVSVTSLAVHLVLLRGLGHDTRSSVADSSQVWKVYLAW